MTEKKKPRNRIAEVRKSKNKTLQEVADAVGVGNNTISRYENGFREPKPEMWVALSNYFRVPVAYLQGYDYSLDDLVKTVTYLRNDLSHNGYNPDTEEVFMMLEKFFFLIDDMVHQPSGIDSDDRKLMAALYHLFEAIDSVYVKRDDREKQYHNSENKKKYIQQVNGVLRKTNEDMQYK